MAVPLHCNALSRWSLSMHQKVSIKSIKAMPPLHLRDWSTTRSLCQSFSLEKGNVFLSFGEREYNEAEADVLLVAFNYLG